MATDEYQFSEGFQMKILALMARDKSTFFTYQDVLQPKYFRKEIHIDIARLVIEHYEQEQLRSKQKGTGITPPTIEVLWEEVRKLTGNEKSPKAKLKKQYQDAVLDIMEADLSDAEYIKDSLIQFGKRAAIERAILESVEDLEKGEDFNRIEERITKAIRVGEDVSDIGVDYFATAHERMENYQKGIEGIERIPTGMRGADKVLKGGLGRSELGVVIAPPNRGKSIMLTNIGAGAVMEGYNVAHYTLEMPEAQVAKRYDSRMVKKDFNYMRENSSNVLTALLNIQKFNKGKLIIKRYATNGCTVNTLRSHLTKLQMETGFTPDVIIVDYGDLVQPRRTYADKRFELESVYLDLRDLGTEFNCAVWTASQANRGALDKKVITIADLAEAFNKANIADFMVALCQTTDEKEAGEMRFHVAKHRDGEANITLEGDIDYPTYVIDIMEHE